MVRQPVPLTVTLPGRAVAYQKVEVRPRVSGAIEAILYKPGATLQVGDPLFRIDDAAYRADVAKARADRAKAEANLPVARAAYERTQKLAGRGYTEAQVESARAAQAEAEATLTATQAALEYAEMELSRTTIKSPIQGIAGIPAVSVGDLVSSAQSDALTTITRLDPIYVDLQEISSRILSVRERIDNGTLSIGDRLQASLILPNGADYRGKGELVTLDTSESTTTGTRTVRFRFENTGQLIIPGMFLRGEFVVGTIDAFLVPQRATQRDASGLLTAFVVGADGLSKQVTLTGSGSYRNSWIVSGGLEAGDRVIVDGLKTMTAGIVVTPIAVEIDADGLVKTVAQSTNAKGD